MKLKLAVGGDQVLGMKFKEKNQNNILQLSTLNCQN